MTADRHTPFREGDLAFAKFGSSESLLLSSEVFARPSWLTKHVAKPFIRTAVEEPLSVLESAKSLVVNKDSLTASKNQQESSQEEQSLLATGAELASGALGAVIVYAVAARGAKALLAQTPLKQISPSMLQSDTGSMVTGAAAYDFARMPKDKESRLGNMLSGMAAFAIFGGGQALSREFSTPLRVLSYPIVGAAGGLIQRQTSIGISEGRILDSGELAESAISGAVMNSALPGAFKLTTLAAENVQRLGGNSQRKATSKAIGSPEAKRVIESPEVNKVIENPEANRALETTEALDRNALVRPTANARPDPIEKVINKNDDHAPLTQLLESDKNLGVTVRMLLKDVLPEADLSKLTERLQLYSSSGNTYSRLVSEVDKNALMEAHRFLKSKSDSSDPGDVATAALALVTIFGKNWKSFLDHLESRDAPLVRSASRLPFRPKSELTGLESWLMATKDHSPSDVLSIAFRWTGILTKFENPASLPFTELEKQALRLEALRISGIEVTDKFGKYESRFSAKGISPGWDSAIAELRILEDHPQLPPPIRRLVLQGLRLEAGSQPTPQSEALYNSMNPAAFKEALERLGLPSNYSKFVDDVRPEDFRIEKEQKEFFSAVALQALRVSSIFGRHTGRWFDSQGALGRGPIAASNIYNKAWSATLTQPIEVRSANRTRETTLAEQIQKNADAPISKIIDIVGNWQELVARRGETEKSRSRVLTERGLSNILGRVRKDEPHPVDVDRLGDWSRTPSRWHLIESAKDVSQTQIDEAVRIANPDTFLRVARIFGNDANEAYQYARAAQIVEHSDSLKGKLGSVSQAFGERQAVEDLIWLGTRTNVLTTDKVAWNYYFQNNGISQIDKMPVVLNWDRIPDEVKAKGGRDLTRYAFAAIDETIPKRLSASLNLPMQDEWKRVAANLAWRAASERLNPTKVFTQELFPAQLSRGRDLTYADAGTEAVVHAFFRQLSASEGKALASALDAMFSKRNVVDPQQRTGIIREIDSKAFSKALDTIYGKTNLFGFNGTELQRRDLERVGSSWQLPSTLNLVSIFGGQSESWLTARTRFGTTVHDATEFLQFHTKEEGAGLAQYLMANAGKKAADLRVVTAAWKTLNTDEKTVPADELVKRIRLRAYPDAKDKSFASEAAQWGIGGDAYKSMEARFLAVKDIPSPFPTEKVWKGDMGLRGYFLKRSDPRGLFLGHHTNCCQHPDGAGASSAWYGLENRKSGFFVVTNSFDEVIAQSWAVVNEKKQLLLDNVEAKGLGKRETAVIDLYQKAANDLQRQFSQVNVGTNSDLPMIRWRQAKSSELVSHPRDYSGYTDAERQAIIAPAKLVPSQLLSTNRSSFQTSFRSHQ